MKWKHEFYFILAKCKCDPSIVLLLNIENLIAASFIYNYFSQQKKIVFFVHILYYLGKL
jgi:hypothetical protein